MFGINPKRSITSLAAVMGLLAAAGSAGAQGGGADFAAKEGSPPEGIIAGLIGAVEPGDRPARAGEIVTNNKDPDRINAPSGLNITGDGPGPDGITVDAGTIERLRERQRLLDVVNLPLTAPLGSTKGSLMGGSSEVLRGACTEDADDLVVDSDSMPQPRACKWEISELDA